MFKPTLRRNGQRMVTVRITHHLTRYDLIALLANDVRNDEIENLTPWSRSQAERTVRASLAVDGYGHAEYWTDALHGDEIEAITDWATEIVDRVWFVG